MSKIPWTEAYRPTEFDEIVLDPLNKQILKNIIETSYFPNVLFYGPPGTGKTTTIINLINSYQAKVGIRNKDLIIHLNASDERGIDIIRNQISFFVNSKPLFHGGMKFVILDEVDYMTKNAQQALKYLLQNYSSSVRFCLICNYISKIDEGLQNEFMRLRFNQLPKYDIIRFLRNISTTEKLMISEKSLELIQKLYKSDIRSMINFMQSKQDIFKTENIKNDKNELEFIIDDSIWETITQLIVNKKGINNIETLIHNISINYNIDKKNIIKDYINYIIRNKPDTISPDFLNFVENVMHSQECNNKTYLYYSLSKLSSFI
uniref:AAA+ ATPase domain-containing protein n=1 Tax=viral metagenome TaxID=1070528 RepID=A0A6C0IFT6_9ZZZZ